MFERLAIHALWLLAFCLGLPAVASSAQESAPIAPGERLNAAVRKSDLSEVAHLVQQGIDVNSRDALGSTPLLDAAWSGNAGICQFLVAHGADVNAKHSESGATALEYAVLTQKVDVVKLLLAAGAQTGIRFRNGETALHLAAERANAEIVELLLAAHADVSALDANDNTPLDDAILHGQLADLKLLLAYGANAKRAHELDGRGTLHEAAMEGFDEAIEPLVKAGANPTLRDHSDQTPLDLALAYKNGTTVTALLRVGLNLKESQEAAAQAMESATMRGQTEIARILIESGFDFKKPTASGSTYLHDAALKGQKKMVELLLGHGASVDALNATGGTPLHDAALGGDPEVIRLLLDRGAAINARDSDESATPLMLAASLGRTKAVALLLERGANPALRDRAGHTALDRARETDDSATILLLKTALAQAGQARKSVGPHSSETL